jgi:hypothetical protein
MSSLLLLWTYNGLIPHDKLMRSIDLFANKVMPQFAEREERRCLLLRSALRRNGRGRPSHRRRRREACGGARASSSCRIHA